ncbi:unnamed protein product, partial [Owenia fusiformis]
SVGQLNLEHMMDQFKGSSPFVVFINGQKVEDDAIEPETTVLDYLRTKLHLVGSKKVCGEGGCGACTVMLSQFQHQTNTVNHYSVNACITPICYLHGMAVTTVEGIGHSEKLHPVQERLAKAHGSQCGFCSPGMVMSMYSLLHNTSAPGIKDIEDAVDGNLCRCTGYRPILEGFKSFAKTCDGCPSNQCKENSSGGDCSKKQVISEPLFDLAGMEKFEKIETLEFPKELKDPEFQKSVKFSGSRLIWYRPTHLTELLELKTQYPDIALVSGISRIGPNAKKPVLPHSKLVSTSHVAEMQGFEVLETGVKVGASMSVTALTEILKQLIEKQEDRSQIKSYQAIVDQLKCYAGPQVRNMSSIGGSILSCQSTSDLSTMLMAAQCSLNIQSKDNKRQVIFDGEFYKDSGTTLEPTEVLTSIVIPHTKQNEYYAAYKEGERNANNLAIVNAAFRVKLQENDPTIDELVAVFGGLAPTAKCVNLEKFIGHTWEDKLVGDVYDFLASTLLPAENRDTDDSRFKIKLAQGFFYKFYLSVVLALKKKGVDGIDIPSSMEPFSTTLDPGSFQSIQLYESVPSGQPVDDPLGRPVVHKSAILQTTGEATYLDDIPPFKNELHMAMLLSTRAHAKVMKVDTADALKLPGVRAYIDHTDVTGSNQFAEDEVVFAEEDVQYQGKVIGAIIAENKVVAQRAVRTLQVQYEDLVPCLTIQDAIKLERFAKPTRQIINGDVDSVMANCDVILDDEMVVGGQKHFYFEPVSARCIPGDGGDMEVMCSSQNLSGIQSAVSTGLGVAAHRVVAKAQRIGGGFGAKNAQPKYVAVPCAVAANKLKCPVRCVLDRSEDMQVIGGRHQLLVKYKVGCSKDGVLQALDVTVYYNCGANANYTGSVLEKTLFEVGNCYKVPNVWVTGRCCLTNITPSNTMRGLGVPSVILVAEKWMMQLAAKLNISGEELRQRNFYREGDHTHYNQLLEGVTLERCWNECMDSSQYVQRKKNVEQFNKENNLKKRGIALMPLKQGVGFNKLVAYQGAALVHIYTDGSVRLTHGGVEMGQGLHTKMIQVAARTLGIPVDLVYIRETSTDLVPNTIPTGGSMNSDLYGTATLNACITLKERLQPYIDAAPNSSWKEWVRAAYMDRVSLSTTGFNKIPISGFDWKTLSGEVYTYYAYGAACTEIELDCLTGAHQILRTDIMYDVGTSLNPAIDVGQIEGAFVQGIGLVTSEKVSYDQNGRPMSTGTFTYKVPTSKDIPKSFNVTLLKDSPNRLQRAVYSSKAVGEPPLSLSASVFLAIHHAVMATRKDVTQENQIRFDSPATKENIRLACGNMY